MLLFSYTFVSLALIWIVAKKNIRIPFPLIIILAFVLRLFITLAFLTSKSDDLNTFLRDGQYLLDRNPKYDASYFPFIAYLGMTAIYLKNVIHPFIFLKIIFSIFDVAILFPLYYLSKRNLQSVLIYALNPISIIVINIHGQMDSIPMFFFLTGLVMYFKNKIFASILTLSWAILTKPWPLLFVIPLIKKSKKKVPFVLLLFFPLLFTFIHSMFFPTPFIKIIEKVENYRGIFGAWGISKIALYLSSYDLNPIVELLMRRIFLVAYVIFSYFYTNKNILKTILMSMFFLFAFSPTFGIQWFVWLVVFVILVKPKFWRIFMTIGSIYLTFGFAWDTYQYLRDIMPLWNSVITRVGFVTWIFIVFMFFSNLKQTSQNH